MVFSLLTGETPADNPSNIVLWVLVGVIIVGFIAWMFFSGRKNKQRQKEYIEQLEAIRPGHKVKTAGGISASSWKCATITPSSLRRAARTRASLG